MMQIKNFELTSRVDMAGGRRLLPLHVDLFSCAANNCNERLRVASLCRLACLQLPPPPLPPPVLPLLLLVVERRSRWNNESYLH